MKFSKCQKDYWRKEGFPQKIEMLQKREKQKRNVSLHKRDARSLKNAKKKRAKSFEEQNY